MKRFKYADERISGKEIMVAIPSIVIGVGILSLPQQLASSTTGADGWLPLMMGGLISIFLTWAVAKFASGFKHQTFLTYASKIVSKPVALVMSFIFALLFLLISAYQTRTISLIAQEYLFDRTPVAVIALTFLLVIVYAVAGSRAALFRINIMFFPIITSIAMVVVLFNFNWFEVKNFMPLFQTDLLGYVEGLHAGVISFLGFGILWFYLSIVDQPNKAPKMAVIGMSLPTVLYLIIYMTTIGTYGNMVTSNLIFPTIELAKMVEVPGEFFERFESIFFVIWIMAIFNTTAMALDVCVLSLHSIFKGAKKIHIILILSPLTYLLAMLPQGIMEVNIFAELLGNSMIVYNVVVLFVLFVVAKVRGVKRDA